MPTLKLAHIREQGQDMIIFPLDQRFGRLPDGEKQQELHALEMRAHDAGLGGHAVAVWDAGGGRMGFLGPSQWHSFLRSISLRQVISSLNREISWT
ncbi:MULTISPECIES: hypothetical protein [unclassified Bradyrhizobium]|uniref:hypothetical protein n=1 Tax=unclassified Bradyrhizobium TaxID=2631580 RepID=UPI00247A73E3|nr:MULTISPECIES: hypothetical protein [unclassified Bradyrhizobium]WGR73277.1 hypothetical protein MTX24_10825 [Bradyrhizobium sp. ISRA426]WGR78114.1 hypothetical protein MTX21_35795 [Bradyrhizobium sp. ISRA430]WGR88515.1 hypothetical protein MTX25_10835 [Bradyrhizobium sp. ISRA432]